MNKDQSGLTVTQHLENASIAHEHTSAPNEQSVQPTDNTHVPDNIHHQPATDEERYQEPKKLENEPGEEAKNYEQHTPKINCPERMVCFYSRC